MVQSGFAGFFILTLVGCLFTLAVSLIESWPRILSAITGPTEAEARALTYRTVHRMPADIPAVAQRLLLSSLDEERPVMRATSLWMMRRNPRRANQLVFAFG